MAQTVIGIFKDDSDVRRAVDRLQGKGISREYVDVSKGEYLDATADREGRNTNRVTDFFNKLFGHDSDDAKRYSTIGESNVTIVTVHTPSRELAEDVADILDDCGAIDVDEHASGYGYKGSASRTEGIKDIGSDRSADRRSEDNLQGRSNMGAGRLRRNSKIIDRSIDDDFRLRGV
jgi:hypothetical protein